jgi:hypothetical protein
MELLQNRRYEPDEISISYLHEIKTQVESIIEVCQEGEIAVYEAENVILEELFCCTDYQSELWEKLDNVEEAYEQKMRTDAAYINELIDKGLVHTEGETGENPSFIQEFYPEGIFALDETMRKWKINDLEKALENMEKYNEFLIEAQDKLGEIFESENYQKKRKVKITQQIIRDGLVLPQEKANNTNEQTSKIDFIESSINHLVTNFPKFAEDYPLLVEKGFLEKTDKGLKWLKSKRSLTDYFMDIKPKNIKRMPWSTIGNIFGEKDLKNSASTNGNPFKGSLSEDFENWLKIKKTPADN